MMSGPAWDPCRLKISHSWPRREAAELQDQHWRRAGNGMEDREKVYGRISRQPGKKFREQESRL